ncbi:MAG: hypothetical protein CL608_32875 [Anaerolineaceae bacterium]|nr:hypothetical protein [Anaerolineaceae bacterium]
MPVQTVSQPQHLPRYFTRLALGLLVLTLTLLLLVTAVGPIFGSLVIDEACETAANGSFESFSAETAVPHCWLVQ